MNGRQAARMAAKRIEELEYFNKSAGATIKRLYQAIDILLEGGNLCEQCEDYEECQLESKNEGKGCPEWSHRYATPSELENAEIGPLEGLTGGAGESEGIFSPGPKG